MRIAIMLSWVIQVILGFMALGSLVCGNLTPALLGLHQRFYDGLLCMFLLFTVAGITQIYENHCDIKESKKRASEL